MGSGTINIDAFGDLRIDGGTAYRARLIRVDDTTWAAFRAEAPTVAIVFTSVAEPLRRGRYLSTELVGGGLLEFRRASCGCQTPQALRGPRSRFVALVPEEV